LSTVYSIVLLHDVKADHGILQTLVNLRDDIRDASTNDMQIDMPVEASNDADDDMPVAQRRGRRTDRRLPERFRDDLPQPLAPFRT
jgi:hypothetical protein